MRVHHACIHYINRTVRAGGMTLEKLTIGWSAIAGSQAPFWITKEAGFFDKNGLDVTMIYVDGGSKATQALMSGDVPIAQVAVMRPWWRACAAPTSP
jgi:ABC-type nitrate/sulfonate/bicarbonate transport system substrate-binding protein